MTIAAPLGFLLAVALVTPCLAGVEDVSPELRAQAIRTCEGDALRLCPEATDEGAAVSCLAGKRPQLTQSCRIVYDQVARVLKQ